MLISYNGQRCILLLPWPQAFTRLLGLQLVDPSKVDRDSLFEVKFPSYRPLWSTIEVQLMG